MATAPFTQPGFDNRISTLAFPLSGGQFGTIQRGFMVWEKAFGPYSSKAQVQFLYNPSSVSADYAQSDPSIAAAYMFPSAFNDVDLRIPLSQVVSFSLLFDRTYELWGAYDSQGLPNGTNNSAGTSPGIVGVLADIMAMQQFTGMFTAYSTGNTGNTSPSPTALTGWQGILQMIPSYVYFGGSNSAQNSLWYYGYISEWDVTVTHWTQYMVPQRCVINVTFNMLPPPQSNQNGNTQISVGPGSTGPGVSTTVSGGLTGSVTNTIPTSGVSGR